MTADRDELYLTHIAETVDLIVANVVGRDGGIADLLIRRSRRLRSAQSCRLRARSTDEIDVTGAVHDRGLTIWTPEPFEADDGSVPFARFVDELDDAKTEALAVAITRVLAARGIELSRTEWLKALGDGLHEFRVRHRAEETARMFGGDAPTVRPPGTVLLRVFVHFHGSKVILLLGGYDKAGDPSPRRQQREIRQARRLLTQFRERKRRQPG